ncbi:response regulator receiver modulated diguanylate cyclase [Ectothiorhodospira mobilis]|uniref:diguanylate cyclase n=2 Tax=Ectothiorhodospira mobilis TaxID=195064 RepID=A0A1I4PRT3_ECTMO|nr:response regulator receiver modulated diguanylate cyclase [Ectothiorhodospira mobilis]
MQAMPSRVPTPMPDSLAQRTVLIVDDQPDSIQVLARLIKDDYRVRVATGGERALEIAQGEDPPDLILLDVEMPGIDGYEVCRRLKSHPRTVGIPVLFITARNDPEDEERGLTLGAVDYISKPFRPAVVRARVRNHMRLKVKSDLLEQYSMRDSLTNVANRRLFDERLAEAWARALRKGHDLTLILMDIDHFKQYNDHYGHGAGDDGLCRVARALHAQLQRPGDLLARYGGEEFVALLPETDAPGGYEVAERLRQGVETQQIPHAACDRRQVTLSLGCATLASGLPREGLHSPADLLQAADRALYRAKAAGRNRVMAAED